MLSKKLKRAREYEIKSEIEIPEDSRPGFHLTPRTGWMNDPNGFSVYKGLYHLFYQYYPYESKWGSMHWGHAISTDLVSWKYLPVALAPDRDYDSFGCFSGTSMTVSEDRHLLMYTNVTSYKNQDGEEKLIQQQSIAIGDGHDYNKYENNPVITTEMIPEGYSVNDFRDPKIWRGKDGIYRVLIGAMNEKGLGSLLLYTSSDCLKWNYKKVFIANDGSYGTMWECPDFFVMEGKGVVIVSPIDMKSDGEEFYDGNGTLCLIGEYDEQTDTFTVENHQSLDSGIDFYAPESIETPDGRRVMIGWMQNWATSNNHDSKEPYFGQMSLPRELTLRNGRLYQQPIRELKAYRGEKVVYENILIQNKKIKLDGIEGRSIELNIELSFNEKSSNSKKFIISMAENEKYHTDIIICGSEGTITFDRPKGGYLNDSICSRSTRISNIEGTIRIQIIIDKSSIEAFTEDGFRVMTTTIGSYCDATGISFSSEGEARINVIKYDLNKSSKQVCEK